MTVTLTAPQDGEQFFEDSRSDLEWFAATPARPAPDGFNPLHAELPAPRSAWPATLAAARRPTGTAARPCW